MTNLESDTAVADEADVKLGDDQLGEFEGLELIFDEVDLFSTALIQGGCTDSVSF